MKNDENKWIEEVLTSMQGSRPATPHPSIFKKIEDRLNQERKIIPLHQWKKMAAAAVLLVGLNVYGYFQISAYHQSSTVVSNQQSSQETLFYNYNIYE